MQTPGIADRKYVNPGRGVACWWEAKHEDGEQSEDQFRFQQQVEACGEDYLLGTTDALAGWCQDGCPDQDMILVQGSGLLKDDWESCSTSIAINLKSSDTSRQRGGSQRD
jgi:hypothetical protein